MPLAWLSFGALIVAIVLSCFTELNIGVVALVLAWIVGVYIGGLSLGQLIEGFPVQLFLTLAGVTMLFAQAQLNGTLDKIAHRAIRISRGNVGFIPVLFFLLGAALSSIGPGNISTTALLAPIAMPVGLQAGVPPLLMAIMVGNGANAGSLSPFAPTGIIVNGSMARIGLIGYEWPTYFNNLVAHIVVAFAGYLVLGGWRLFRKSYVREDQTADVEPFDRSNWITIVVIAMLIAAVIVFGVNVGMGAFAGAVLLPMLGAANHKDAIRQMPWSVIMLVSGVTVLIALLERFQGIDLFTAMLAQISNKDTVTGVVGFVTAFISVYSSTSGVVLPAFIPTIPGLIERLGGGDPMAIASSMNVSSHLVDVSPVSTIGALCLAAMPASENVRGVFNKLLAWGLSMTLVGAVASYLMF
jgi:Na+/H+ antiporter NhaD/arsenite permease-like protein